MEELKMIAQYGIGGAIAALMFHFYRQDRKQSEGDRSAAETRCAATAAAAEARHAEDRARSDDRYEALAQNFRSMVQENTAALRAVLTELRHQGAGSTKS